MRVLLRCLIGVNWTAAGIAFAMAVESHPVLWQRTIINLAISEPGKPPPRDLAPFPDPPELEARRAWAGGQVTPLYESGETAWWAACVLGCANALTLIAAFRRLPRADCPEIEGK